MKCRVKLVAVLAVLLSLMGAQSECGSRTTSNRPPEERAPGAYAFEVSITAYVGDGKGLPATVQVDVTDQRGGHDAQHDIITQSERKWRTKVRYNPGQKLHIRVEVKPSKPNTGVACEIYDASNTRIDGPVWRGWRAICELDTVRG